MIVTWVTVLAMAGFMVGAVVGNEADVRAAEKEARDLAEADEFVSIMRGTAPALFIDQAVA